MNINEKLQEINKKMGVNETLGAKEVLLFDCVHDTYTDFEDEVKWMQDTIKQLQEELQEERKCFSLLEDSIESFFETEEQREIFRKYHESRGGK
ncbi:hypothetical protein [Metabacillus idriensis]|uniref:hypothetical protein n=1 Tax=Metabacillus idriensis TaxID=324768 RepID=UPI00174C2D9C|nr:hypothetical protein [Metabacillus idriensis]